jgi:hypothetical protein
VTNGQLHRAIRRQSELALDLEIGVDDARETVARAVAELQERVRERDRAVAHLANLIALASESGVDASNAA